MARKKKEGPASGGAPDTRVGRATAIFASGTLFSRALGMVRDTVIAIAVPDASRDAFIVAFRMPNMLRDLLGEGAMNAAFVPVFAHTKEENSEAEFRVLVSAAMSAMLLLLLVVSLLGVAFVPQLLRAMNALEGVTGSKPDADNLELAISLTRWTFPYIFFIGLTVFAMGPLFTLRHYATPSWSPALLNVSMILSCFVFYRYFPHVFPDPAYVLVFGVWLGGVTQLVVQYYALGRVSGVWLPNFRIWHPGVREICWLMVPVALGQAAGEVNKLVDTLFAYSLEPGTVTAFFYANRLIQLPLSVFGIATAAALLPAVASSAAQARKGAIRASMMQGMRQTYFLVLPSTLGLIVLGRPIIRLLFEWGRFNAELADKTATAMAIYAVGLLSFAFVKVAVTGFYGMKDTKTPVIIASGAMLLNIVLNFVLIRPLGYKGLAIATTISYTVNFAVLYGMLARQYGKLWDAPFFTALMRITVAAVMSIAVAHAIYLRVFEYLTSERLASWLQSAGAAQWADTGAMMASRILCAGIPLGVAMGGYAALCYILDVGEMRGIMRILQRKRG